MLALTTNHFIYFMSIHNLHTTKLQFKFGSKEDNSSNQDIEQKKQTPTEQFLDFKNSPILKSIRSLRKDSQPEISDQATEQKTVEAEQVGVNPFEDKHMLQNAESLPRDELLKEIFHMESVNYNRGNPIDKNSNYFINVNNLSDEKLKAEYIRQSKLKSHLLLDLQKRISRF
jgi:hypothetical protein